jgi:hypothetical protein
LDSSGPKLGTSPPHPVHENALRPGAAGADFSKVFAETDGWQQTAKFDTITSGKTPQHQH